MSCWSMFLPASAKAGLLGCSGHRQQQFDHLEHFAVVIAFLGLLPIGDADAIGPADRFLVTFIFIYVHYVYFFLRWDWVAFSRFSFALFSFMFSLSEKRISYSFVGSFIYFSISYLAWSS